MKRVIGIVSEGPTDQMAIRTVIDRLTGEKNIYRYIQPEQDARGEFGNGWKGVYRWCENNAELIPALFSQIMPRSDHVDSPESYRAHLTSVIRQLVRSDDENEQLIITIPCDSTDAWIVAAFDDLKDSNDAEMIIDPWSNIISLKKEYHGIRVPGHKKSASVYRRFMPQLSDNWDTVAEKCKSARVFTDSIQLLHDRTD